MIIFNFKFRDMKKQVLMMAALALALGGCSKTETTGSAQGGVIGFAGSGVNNITKAEGEIITADGFDQFLVYGGYGTDAVIFNGVEVTKSENNWTYTNTQYWQVGTWKFAGYAPQATGITPVWNHTPGLQLTVNSDMDNQNDLVYAATTDDIEITSENVNTYETEVPLSFTHLLSQIKFNFTKGTSVAGNTVKLYDFKVSGIYANGVWNAGTLDPVSGETEEYTDFGTAEETAEEVLTEGGLETQHYFVIPQPVGTFNITFSAVVTDAGGAEIRKGTVTATVPNDTYTTWDAQNAYLYSAVIEIENIDDPNNPDLPKPIEFTASAGEWETVKTDDVTLADVTAEP